MVDHNKHFELFEGMIAHSLVVGKLEGMVGGMTDYWEVGDYFGLDNH